MWSIRIFFQKIHKIIFRVFSLGKDRMIQNLLKLYNIKYTILIYDLITYSPIEHIMLILCGKFGISKAIVLLIIAFLL